MNRSEYSRHATHDVRTAISIALSRYLRNLPFTGPTGSTFWFSQVFEEWPSYDSKFVPPSAAVIPTGWKYDQARLTPSLIESTWEPQDQATHLPLHEPGFGLYKLADIDMQMEVQVRSAHVPEREAIIAGMEVAFVSPDVTQDPTDGARYGIFLPMPEYWGLEARYALDSVRLLDNEETAVREQRQAVFILNVQAPHVTLAPVRPMMPRIEIRDDC